MAFCDLEKEQRELLVEQIKNDIYEDLVKNSFEKVLVYFSDTDTYIRKAAYLNIGKMLKELQDEKPARVLNMVIHVIGQIAYKKGCLETVAKELLTWENKTLVKEEIDEIIDVHERYKNFSACTQQEAISYLSSVFDKHYN